MLLQASLAPAKLLIPLDLLFGAEVAHRVPLPEARPNRNNKEKTMRNRALLTALTLGLCLTAGAAHAACPTGVYYIDLKSGLAGTIGGPTQVSLQSPLANSPTTACGAGWKEAVLKVDLTGCTSARLVAQYEGLPHDWTLNIGDSPTNDGFGGDAGTTDNDAELWINQE